MTKRLVNLNAIDSVKEFVNIVSKYAYEADLGSGRHNIDAKSIMGVFSLDLSKPIELTIHAEESECADLLNEISKFIV